MNAVPVAAVKARSLPDVEQSGEQTTALLREDSGHTERGRDALTSMADTGNHQRTV